MHVIIVSKTRMGAARCVGGLAANNQSVRLLDANGHNQPGNTPFEIGTVWDLQFVPRQDCRPPHVEDVLITSSQRVGEQANLRHYIIEHAPVWNGPIDVLFDGLLEFTHNGSGYIAESTGLPAVSTGFWISDRELTRNGRAYIYDYRQLAYVGAAEPVDALPAGTLIRVSLARWWRPQGANPDFEERCYLQLSGWYL